MSCLVETHRAVTAYMENTYSSIYEFMSFKSTETRGAHPPLEGWGQRSQPGPCKLIKLIRTPTCCPRRGAPDPIGADGRCHVPPDLLLPPGTFMCCQTENKNVAISPLSTSPVRRVVPPMDPGGEAKNRIRAPPEKMPLPRPLGGRAPALGASP